MSGMETSLKRLRKGAGYSVQEVLDATSFSQATYYRCEKGQSRIPEEEIPPLCQLFDCSVQELLGLEDASNSTTENADSAKPSTEEDELEAMRAVLRDRPEMRMLFSLTKDATTDDVLRAVRIIEALEGRMD